MLKEDIVYKECSFDVLLAFANSTSEKNRAIKQNSNVRTAIYPLTKSFLQNYYLSTDFSNLKKTMNNVNCASDVYSYFVSTYGLKVGTGTASGAGQSSGLNPFSPITANLGFNFGEFGFWLWIIIAGLIVYKVTE